MFGLRRVQRCVPSFVIVVPLLLHIFSDQTAWTSRFMSSLSLELTWSRAEARLYEIPAVRQRLQLEHGCHFCDWKPVPRGHATGGGGVRRSDVPSAEWPTREGRGSGPRPEGKTAKCMVKGPLGWKLFVAKVEGSRFAFGRTCSKSCDVEGFLGLPGWFSRSPDEAPQNRCSSMPFFVGLSHRASGSPSGLLAASGPRCLVGRCSRCSFTSQATPRCTGMMWRVAAWQVSPESSGRKTKTKGPRGFPSILPLLLLLLPFFWWGLGFQQR